MKSRNFMGQTPKKTTKVLYTSFNHQFIKSFLPFLKTMIKPSENN
jgi:hypothetical protein